MTRNLTQVAGSFIGTMEEFHTPEKKPLVSPIIHITDSQTDKILDFIPLGDFWDDNHHKSLRDTIEMFDFKTFGNKRYSQHLTKMNRVIIPDEDGTYIEFVIDTPIKYRSNGTLIVEVYTSASYLQLKKAKVINPQKITGTASQHLGFALNDTEFRPGIVESNKTRTIDIERHTNPYAYIKRIANEFELEPRFRVETDGNKVIGRYVDLLERVGGWQGREVEFGKDLLGIQRKEDFSNIVTALIGLGPEREDGTRLEVFVEDEESLQRWGRRNHQTGELMHMIEVYEPESFDPDMTIERLTELTRNELEKRINSVVEYIADVVDLERVPGMENKKIRFGDTIKIKDTEFNPPLYLEARVHTQERSISQPEKKKIILGDYIEYSEEEVNAIWRQLQAEIAKKVNAQQLYDYTYSKLVIDNKDEAVRSDVESYANTVSANAKDEAIIYTNNTVNPIIVRVDDIEEDVANHENLISQAQTDITQAFNEINLRATKTELDTVKNQVNDVVGEINVLSGQVELRATKTEVDALKGRVSTAEGTISNLANEIELKVNVDGVITAINLSPEVIKIDADRIEFEGHVFGEDATFIGTIEGSTIIGSLFISETTDSKMRLDNASITFEKSGWISSSTILNSNGIWRYRNNGEPAAVFGGSSVGDSAAIKFFYGVNDFNVPIDALEFYFGPVTGGETYKANILKYSKDLIFTSYSGPRGANKFIVDKIHFADVLQQDTYFNPPVTYGRIEYANNKILIQGENGGSFELKDISRLEFTQSSAVNFDSYGNIVPKSTVSPTANWHVDDVSGKRIIEVGIGSSGGYVNMVNNNLQILPDGRIISPGTYNNTGSGSVNLRITDNGYLVRVTSATKYKADIQEVDLSDGYAKRILNLKPKSWFDRAELESNDENVVPQRYFGLIAEDVEEAGLSEYVTYLNGEIEGIEYDRLWTLLIPIVKEHEDLIAWLETENHYLKQKIRQLEELIA